MTSTENPPPDSSGPQKTESLGRLLEARMRALLDRVRRRFLVHGLGWMAAAVAIGLVVYFALDRVLDLPTAVRLVLTVVLTGFLVYGFRRRLAYPLRRKITGEDIAIAVERRFPELEDRLISAVQLAGEQQSPLRGQSSAMVSKFVEEAADEVSNLPTGQILDSRRTMRVWGIAAVAMLVASVVLLRDTKVTGVFFARMVGSATSYPRETKLCVELPSDDPALEIEIGDGVATVVLAAGGTSPSWSELKVSCHETLLSSSIADAAPVAKSA